MSIRTDIFVACYDSYLEMIRIELTLLGLEVREVTITFPGVLRYGNRYTATKFVEQCGSVVLQ